MKKHHARTRLATLATCSGLILMLSFTVAGFVAAPPMPPGADEGERTYRNHCSECHGVRVAKIRPTTKDAREKGPDLTGIGDKYPAAWIKQYVKVEETRGGKRHTKKFKGSDEELQVLVDWLLEQRAEDDE